MTEHNIKEHQISDARLESTTIEPKVTRISPYKVLESLSSLRIDIKRIKLPDSGAGARGGNADVRPAELEPAEGSESTAILHIAVKKLRFYMGDENDRVLVALAHEVSLLNDLSHENIVRILGFVEDTENGIAWMIFLWEANGNLREFVASADWEFPERLSLIYDVAKGIAYLHGRNPPIVHGDLKSLNVLVNSDNKGIITDFGSARRIEPSAHEADSTNLGSESFVTGTQPRVEIPASGNTITLTGAQWTLRWAAPELLENDVSGLPSDIWAFGWICWEVLTGIFPFNTENDVAAVLRIIEGRLPAVHSDRRTDQVVALASLMIDCWSLSPEKRPNAMICERQIFWMDRITPRLPDGDKSPRARSARLDISIATTHIRNCSWTEALDHLDRAVYVAGSTGDHSALAEASRRRATVYRMKGDHKLAESSLQLALDISTQLQNSLEVANAHFDLGELYRVQWMSAKAEDHYSCARATYSQIGHDLGVAYSCWGLGQLYYAQSKYVEAEELLASAQKLYEQLGNQSGLAHVAKLLGDLYRCTGRGPQADALYTTARNIHRRIGDKPGHIYLLHSLGIRFLDEGQYRRSKQAFEEAHGICIDAGMEGSLAHNLWYRGSLCRKQHSYGEAEKFVSDARIIYRQLGMDDDASECDIFVIQVQQLKKEQDRRNLTTMGIRSFCFQVYDP